MKTSGLKQIAERYVRALFDVAGSSRDQVEQDLNQLGKAIEDSTEFQQFLNNPLLTREQQQQAFSAILEKMGAQDITKKFIAMLIKQKRVAILPEIAKIYSDWATAARGELKAELIATAPLNVRVVDMVAEKLSNAYGKKVVVEVRHDPSLLGGVIIKIGSQQLDSSLAGKMRRLKNALRAA